MRICESCNERFEGLSFDCETCGAFGICEECYNEYHIDCKEDDEDEDEDEWDDEWDDEEEDSRMDGEHNTSEET